MPRGNYLHRDPHDGAPLAIEEFQAAAGPAGWRYFGTLHPPDAPDVLGRIDVTVDLAWRQLRVELTSGGWQLRGGVSGRETVWVRAASGGEETPQEFGEIATGFIGRSPGLLVPLARRLRLEVGAQVRVRAVEVSWPALGTRAVEQGWRLAERAEHPTDTEPLPIERFEIADLETGEARVVHLAGDVVLDAPGLELTALETPPTL